MQGCVETCWFCQEWGGGGCTAVDDRSALLLPMHVCLWMGGSRPQTSLCNSLSSSVTTVISPLTSLFSQMLEQKPPPDLKCTRTSQLTQNLVSAASTATSCLFLVFVPPRQPACFCAAIRNTRLLSARLVFPSASSSPLPPPVTSFPSLLSLASSSTCSSPQPQNRRNRCTITKPPTDATFSPLIPLFLPAQSPPPPSPGKHTSNQ